MADEPTPNADGIMPSNPRPYSAFPAEPGSNGAPPATVDVTPAGPARIATEPLEPEQKSIAGAHRGELVMLLCWLTGLCLILLCGWTVIGLGFYLDHRLGLHLPTEAIFSITALIAFGCMLLLEKDMWLSRFMGLKLTPYSTQITEALFFTTFGVAGILLRSSGGDKPALSTKTPPKVDGTREIVETVVFVVVLVLLLKTFVVEAFVIPTGSMATTLLGYHKKMTCEECGYHFLVNCSAEVEPQEGRRQERVQGGHCPNCRFFNKVPHLAIDADRGFQQ